MKKKHIFKIVSYTILASAAISIFKAIKNKKKINDDKYNDSGNNKGYGNIGSNNIGDNNWGYFNITSNALGLFNTNPSPIYCFNKPAENFTLDDYEFSVLSDILDSMPPINEKTEAAVKERQKWYDNLPEYFRDEIKGMPNFNAELFKSITGITIV